jgi:DNA-directed RNA polymerase subunit RPC12/RpoP
MVNKIMVITFRHGNCFEYEVEVAIQAFNEQFNTLYPDQDEMLQAKITTLETLGAPEKEISPYRKKIKRNNTTPNPSTSRSTLECVSQNITQNPSTSSSTLECVSQNITPNPSTSNSNQEEVSRNAPNQSNTNINDLATVQVSDCKHNPRLQEVIYLKIKEKAQCIGSLENKYSCGVCQKLFRSKKDTSTHATQHYLKYKCRICGTEFSSHNTKHAVCNAKQLAL